MSWIDWTLGLYGITAPIEKRLLSMKKSVTFKKDVRDVSLATTNMVVDKLAKDRANGDVDDEQLYLRDLLILLHSTLADQIQGTASMQEGNKFYYDELSAKFYVKKLLEAGADVKALFFPIFEDDDEESLWRISLNCLKLGVRMYPLYFDGEKREDEGFPDLNPVYIDLSAIYDQTYTLGELATIYCYKPVPDIIAMLIRADADFMVRTNDNPQGVHALVRILQKDFAIEKEDKQMILDAYKSVYLNKHNKLSPEQRQGIVDVMTSCIDEKNPISKTILPEDQELIKGTISEMLTGSHNKTETREK